MPAYESVIVCTPGGATDNCYTDLAGASGYYANTLRAATWEAFTEAQREQALIQATQEIEAQGGALQFADSPARVRFPGAPYYATGYGQTQALHFPTGNDQVASIGGSVVVQVPPEVVAAVCEQALWLLQQQSAPALVDHAALQAAGVKSFSMDGLSVSYGAGSAPPGIAPQAWAKLSPLVRRVWGTS